MKMSNAIDLAALARNYSNHGHSIFGPSSSHMWLTCAGSLVPNLLAPDEGSEFAAYGTVAHAVSEEWLIARKRPRHLLGTTQIVYAGDWGYLVNIDEAMMEFAEQSVEMCMLLPGKHFTEQRVDFSRLTPIPNQGGTMDFAAIEGRRVVVVDHKFGTGVQVYAEENTQAMLYALGLLYRYDKAFGGTHDMREFVLRIHQPRLDHFDEWECSRDHLLTFAGRVIERAKAAWRLDAPRTPDPKACQFCKVRSTCSANAKMQIRIMADQTADAFGEVTHDELVEFKAELASGTFSVAAADPLALSTSDLETLRPFKRMVEGFWKTIDHELMKRAMNGAQLKRYKIVEGRSNRVFSEPAQAAKVLIAHGCKPSEVIVQHIASPAEAEELLTAAGHRRRDLPDLLEGLVRKPPGKPTLASITDRRPALEDMSAIAFAGETQTDETDSE
jgi:hypothetical protein